MKVLKDLQEKEEEDMESRGTFGNVKFLVYATIFFFINPDVHFWVWLIRIYLHFQQF
jgi:hypothetical protein